MPNDYLIPYCQFRSNSCILFDKWEGPRRNAPFREKRSANLKAQRSKAYSGMLTHAAKKRMEKAITLLVQSAQPRRIYNPVRGISHYHTMSFVTLTISSNERNYTAKEAYRLTLRPFLQWMCKYKGVRLYVWKAELQKRGQIHYHLITPSFIHYQEIRDKWNHLQAAAGMLDAFYAAHGHRDPNSTDIHSCRKIRNVAQYLIKYLSKEEKTEARTTGKVWDCSLNLKKAKYYTSVVDSSLLEELTKIVEEKKAVAVSADRCTIIRFKAGKPQQAMSIAGLHDFYSYLLNIRNAPPLPAKRHRPAGLQALKKAALNYDFGPGL